MEGVVAVNYYRGDFSEDFRTENIAQTRICDMYKLCRKKNNFFSEKIGKSHSAENPSGDHLVFPVPLQA